MCLIHYFCRITNRLNFFMMVGCKTTVLHKCVLIAARCVPRETVWGCVCLHRDCISILDRTWCWHQRRLQMLALVRIQIRLSRYGVTLYTSVVDVGLPHKWRWYISVFRTDNLFQIITVEFCFESLASVAFIWWLLLSYLTTTHTVTTCVVFTLCDHMCRVHTLWPHVSCSHTVTTYVVFIHIQQSPTLYSVRRYVNDVARFGHVAGVNPRLLMPYHELYYFGWLKFMVLRRTSLVLYVRGLWSLESMICKLLKNKDENVEKLYDINE